MDNQHGALIAAGREVSRRIREKSKVRGMIVKGMGKSIFRFILTIIPLRSGLFHPPF
jgi:hypothetical protein